MFCGELRKRRNLNKNLHEVVRLALSLDSWWSRENSKSWCGWNRWMSDDVVVTGHSIEHHNCVARSCSCARRFPRHIVDVPIVADLFGRWRLWQRKCRRPGIIHNIKRELWAENLFLLLIVVIKHFLRVLIFDSRIFRTRSSLMRVSAWTLCKQTDN